MFNFSKLVTATLIVICGSVCAADGDDPGKKEGEGAKVEVNEAAKAEVAAAQTMPKFTLTERMYKKTKDYFPDGIDDAGTMYDFFILNPSARFEKTDPRALGGALGGPMLPREPINPKKAVEYNIEDQSAVVFIPKNFESPKGWGIYIHLSDEAMTDIPEDWKAIFEKQKFIFACPNGADISAGDIHRMALALDTAATIAGEYDMGKSKVIIGGTNQGGRVAILTALNHPKKFEAAVSSGESLMLKKEIIGGYSEGRGLNEEQFSIHWPWETPWFNFKLAKKAKSVKLVLWPGDDEPGRERVFRSFAIFDGFKIKCDVFEADTGTAFSQKLDVSFDRIGGQKIKSFKPNWSKYLKTYERLRLPTKYK